MSNDTGFNNVRETCETCQHLKCPCYCSACWQSEKPVDCNIHPSTESLFEHKDTHVIIVSGDGTSAENFRRSSKQLRKTLTDGKFLGLSKDNVTVIKEPSEANVQLRLLSLKFELENKLIKKALSHILKKYVNLQEHKKELRDIIALAGDKVWETVAKTRCKRIGNVHSQSPTTFNHIFDLAWTRARELEILLTKRTQEENPKVNAEKVQSMLHLWKSNVSDEYLKTYRENELEKLTDPSRPSQPSDFVQNLGCMIDEFFQVVIRTSCLSVSSNSPKSWHPALESKILEKLDISIETFRRDIIGFLKPLPKGLLWYYYIGDAKGLGDDELNVLPKLLMEATGRLLANMVVTLDCSHADANLPNIVHFVENDTVSTSYTSLTSCTARQKANYNGKQPFTEFLIFGLRSADGDCRQIFERCFDGKVCRSRQCDACRNYQQLNGQPCEICDKFRSSTRKIRSLAEIFAYVKAHLCKHSMYPIMRRSRPEHILPIAYVCREASARNLYEPETTRNHPLATGSEMLSIFPGVPDIPSGSMKAQVIIVSGTGKGETVFQKSCERLQKVLTNPHFVGVSEDNVSVLEASSKDTPTVIQKLVSLLFHLEERVIDNACSHVLAILGQPSKHFAMLRQVIYGVCTQVRKKLAFERINRKKFLNGEDLVSKSGVISKEHVQSLFEMACERAKELEEPFLLQKNSSDSDEAVKKKEIERKLWALFRPIKVKEQLEELPSVSENEDIKLKEIEKNTKHSLNDLRIKVNTYFRELIVTPFLPVSIDAINMVDSRVLKTAAKTLDEDVQIFSKVIIDALRPLRNELIWYHYCGHATGVADDVLDEEVLPKALLEATGRLVANLVVTLNCCHAEAHIPDIKHFMDDRRCSSFLALASCNAVQESYYIKNSISHFTEFLTYGLKSASGVCTDVFKDPNDDHSDVCESFQNKSCKTCSKFRSPAKSFHTLTDIFNLTKAHFYRKRTYLVMRQTDVNCSLRVARVLPMDHESMNTPPSPTDINQGKITNAEHNTFDEVLRDIVHDYIESTITSAGIQLEDRQPIDRVMGITYELRTPEERQLATKSFPQKMSVRACKLDHEYVQCFVDALTKTDTRRNIINVVKQLLIKRYGLSRDCTADAKRIINVVLRAFWHSLQY